MNLSEALEIVTLLEETLRSALLRTRRVRQKLEARIDEEIKPNFIREAEEAAIRAIENYKS